MKLYRVNALLRKYFYISTSTVDRFFDVFYWPVLDLILWGFTSFFILKLSNVNLLSMLLGGVILWLFVWRASQDIGIFVLEDFWQRNLYNMFTTPVRSSELIMAVLIFAVYRSVITFLFVSFLGYLLYSFNIFEIGIMYIGLFAFLLVMIGWVMGLVISGMIFRLGQRIQVLVWSFAWILQPFSCVFYPLSALPSWAQKIAVFLPTTHVFEAMRAVLSGADVRFLPLLYSFFIVWVLLAVSGYYLKASIDKARKLGLLSRYE